MSILEVKITDLTLATTLDGTEEFECVQSGDSRKVTTDYFPRLQYGYLTINDQPQLPNARQLTAGAGVTFIDGGPGSTLTVIASTGAGGPTYWTTYESPVLPAGNTDNLVVAADTVVLRITPNAGGSSLTGITPTPGRMLVILNIATVGDLTLPNQSASSLAANRFTNVGSFDVIVPVGGSVRYWYDLVSTTWRSV